MKIEIEMEVKIEINNISNKIQTINKQLLCRTIMIKVLIKKTLTNKIKVITTILHKITNKILSNSKTDKTELLFTLITNISKIRNHQIIHQINKTCLREIIIKIIKTKLLP